MRAGYYCIYTFMPINRNAFLAASRAVDCTLTAAEKLLKGFRSGTRLGLMIRNESFRKYERFRI